MMSVPWVLLFVYLYSASATTFTVIIAPPRTRNLPSDKYGGACNNVTKSGCYGGKAKIEGVVRHEMELASNKTPAADIVFVSNADATSKLNVFHPRGLVSNNMFSRALPGRTFLVASETAVTANNLDSRYLFWEDPARLPFVFSNHLYGGNKFFSKHLEHCYLTNHTLSNGTVITVALFSVCPRAIQPITSGAASMQETLTALKLVGRSPDVVIALVTDKITGPEHDAMAATLVGLADVVVHSPHLDSDVTAHSVTAASGTVVVAPAAIAQYGVMAVDISIASGVSTNPHAKASGIAVSATVSGVRVHVTEPAKRPADATLMADWSDAVKSDYNAYTVVLQKLSDDASKNDYQVMTAAAEFVGDTAVMVGNKSVVITPCRADNCDNAFWLQVYAQGIPASGVTIGEKPKNTVYITNGGGLRAGIAAGPVTLSSLLKSSPFTDELCYGDVTGLTLLQILNFSVSVGGVTNEKSSFNGPFLQIGGAKLHYDATLPVSSQTTRLLSVTVENVNTGVLEEVDLSATYRLVAPGFICSGGDGYNFFTWEAGPAYSGEDKDSLSLEYLAAVAQSQGTAMPAMSPADRAPTIIRYTHTTRPAATMRAMDWWTPVALPVAESGLTKGALYGIIIGGSFFFIVLVAAGIFLFYLHGRMSSGEREIKRQYEILNVAERAAEAIADMHLEGVQKWLAEIQDPTPLQSSFITIINTLILYRSYLPAHVLNADAQAEAAKSIKHVKDASRRGSVMNSARYAGNVPNSARSAKSSRSKGSTVVGDEGAPVNKQQRAAALKDRLATHLHKSSVSILAVVPTVLAGASSVPETQVVSAFDELTTLVTTTASTYRGEVQIAPTGELYIIWSSLAAQVDDRDMLALGTLLHGFDKLAARSLLDVYAGSVRDTVLTGNLGNLHSKQSVVLGRAMATAAALAWKARELGLECLVSSSAHSKVTTNYGDSELSVVFMPRIAAIFQPSPNNIVDICWTVVATQDVQGDEWLYQLSENETDVAVNQTICTFLQNVIAGVVSSPEIIKIATSHIGGDGIDKRLMQLVRWGLDCTAKEAWPRPLSLWCQYGHADPGSA